jgi:phosphatidylinositol alpha-1,6-mannosyltransferase
MAATIVILSEDFPPRTGGIAQWAIGVATSLHELGYQVIVITRRWKEFPELTQGTYAFSLRYVHGNHWKKLRTWYWRRAIKALYAEGIRPDLLIASTWNAARGVMVITKRYKTRTAIVVHGLEVTRRMNLFKQWWCRQTLQNADAIVAVSAFTGRRVTQAFPNAAKKICVIPNGVDNNRFKPGIDTSALRERFGLGNRKVLLTLARIIERKGYDQVIRALPAIIKKVPDVIYCIAGDPAGGYVETLKRLASDLHVNQHVVFVGYVDDADLPAYYNLCNVYIMPSREIAASGDTEGFGITFLEANACEKPVIGGKSGGVSEAIVNGETGFLVDPVDTAMIAEKAIMLLNDQTLAKKLGRQGRERIERGFTWQSVAKRLLKKIALTESTKDTEKENE